MQYIMSTEKGASTEQQEPPATVRDWQSIELPRAQNLLRPHVLRRAVIMWYSTCRAAMPDWKVSCSDQTVFVVERAFALSLRHEIQRIFHKSFCEGESPNSAGIRRFNETTGWEKSGTGGRNEPIGTRQTVAESECV